ncbi:hypothetical protein [Paenibacillus illinoisensis]|uniref:hypothetical protein n=1 Tax=Paenibacillus illinoisensis TaxID=59845 RepID=UPI00203DF518|nr:hypothetical protein [Paenibacillus illinoisensis]MCM3206416.1 hypothetical protein [Paenibacillus illinoisensis]
MGTSTRPSPCPMGSPWTRWSVYEYMKHRFVRTGQVPDQDELQNEFAGIDQTELLEGIAEFGAIAGEWPELEAPHAKVN